MESLEQIAKMAGMEIAFNPASRVDLLVHLTNVPYGKNKLVVDVKYSAHTTRRPICEEIQATFPLDIRFIDYMKEKEREWKLMGISVGSLSTNSLGTAWRYLLCRGTTKRYSNKQIAELFGITEPVAREFRLGDLYRRTPRATYKLREIASIVERISNSRLQIPKPSRLKDMQNPQEFVYDTLLGYELYRHRGD